MVIWCLGEVIDEPHWRFFLFLLFQTTLTCAIRAQSRPSRCLCPPLRRWAAPTPARPWPSALRWTWAPRWTSHQRQWACSTRSPSPAQWTSPRSTSQPQHHQWTSPIRWQSPRPCPWTSPRRSTLPCDPWRACPSSRRSCPPHHRGEPHPSFINLILPTSWLRPLPSASECLLYPSGSVLQPHHNSTATMMEFYTQFLWRISYLDSIHSRWIFSNTEHADLAARFFKDKCNKCWFFKKNNNKYIFFFFFPRTLGFLFTLFSCSLLISI